MRVLLLPVSGALGGAERVLLDLAAALRLEAPPWTLGAIALQDGPLVPELRALGVEVQVLPLPPAFAALGERGRSTAATLTGLAASTWAVRRYARDLGGRIAAWRPDVIHSNGMKAHVLSAWVTPKACALIWHAHDYVGPRRVSSLLLRRYAHRTSAIIANSASVAADVTSVVGRGARVVTIHNGIDLQRFRPDGASVDLDRLAGLAAAAPGTLRVGLVATYARWKGHDIFLRALACLPLDLALRGYIVGGPVYQTRGSQWSADELRSEIEALGLEGRVGLVPFQHDTAPVYRALDIAVHASTSAEPFGLSIVEAMASGRVVIVSGAGGAAEIVTPEVSGVMHRPADAAHLARQIERLCQDPAQRRRLGQCAAADVRRRFDRARFGAAVACLYRSASAGVPVEA